MLKFFNPILFNLEQKPPLLLNDNLFCARNKGVNFVMRNLAKTSTPTVEITKDGDTFTLKTITAIKNSEIKFELGKEFEENRIDGVKVKTVVVADGNKLVQTQFGDKEVKIVREFNGDELKVVSSPPF